MRNRERVMDFFIFFFYFSFFLLATQLNRAPLIRKWTGPFLQHISHSPSSFTDCATKWFWDFVRSEKQNNVSRGKDFEMSGSHGQSNILCHSNYLWQERLLTKYMYLPVKHSAKHPFIMGRIMCFHKTLTFSFVYQRLFLKCSLVIKCCVLKPS